MVHKLINMLIKHLLEQQSLVFLIPGEEGLFGVKCLGVELPAFSIPTAV